MTIFYKLRDGQKRVSHNVPESSQSAVPIGQDMESDLKCLEGKI